MSQPHQPSQPDGAFEALEAAIRETARGRWFLAEHARRSRAAETRILLGALARLETVVSGRPTLEGVDRLRGDLADMTAAIARAKAEVAALAGDGAGAETLVEASATLDGIVRETEKATFAILDATEKVQETAWTLRERGFDPALCDALDARATEIYAACEFQDLTAQRVDRVVRILGYLETRIAAMNGIWGTPSPKPSGGRRPLPPPPALTQTDIDFVVIDEDRPASKDVRSAARPDGGVEVGGAESPVATLLARLQALDPRPPGL